MQASVGRKQNAGDRSFADYVFDLKDEAAREAFLQAVSGGAVVLSTRIDAAKFIDPKKPLHNLV